MTILRHNFEGGSQDQVITATSYSTPDDPWDVVPPHYANTTNIYSRSLTRPSAEWIGTVGTVGSTGVDDPCWVWQSLGNCASIHARWYNKINVVPSATVSPTIFGMQTGGSGWSTGSTWCAFVSLGVTSQKLVIADGNGANPVYTTNPYLIDAWFRVEVEINFSATAGSGEIRLYNTNPDATVDDWEDRIVFSGMDFNSATASRFGFGLAYPYDEVEDISFSGIALSTDGEFIGPAPFRPGKGYPAGNLSNPVSIHQHTW